MRSGSASPHVCAAQTRKGPNLRGSRVRRTAFRVTVACLVVGGAAIAGGCGGSAGAEAADHSEAIHVHGLGIDSVDGALLLGTHTGLFRLAPGGSAPRRVGDLFHDLMGLAVAGPGRLLASGHPDLRTGLPVLLGLVESRDGGESWQPVSLLGEADFHVLRASGPRIYAADGVRPLLRLSTDEGSTWHSLRTPAPLLDFAIHPADASRLVASSPKGLFSTAKGGRAWRPIAGPRGLLSWPAPNLLYAADPSGTVWSSSNQGGSWTRAGDAGGAPAAMTATGDALYVALEAGLVRLSRDRGRSWQTIAGA